MGSSRPWGDHLVLVGMMGAGKSAVGPELARRLEWPYLDSDAQVEHIAGRGVEEIWRTEGEAAFRSLEAKVLADALESGEPAVVAAAGGVVLDAANRRRLMDNGPVVWLRARVPTLVARVGEGAGRPLLDGGPAAALGRLSAERQPFYEQVADLVVDVDDLDPPGVAQYVLDQLGARS